LKEFAAMVQKKLRSSDIFTRWGGDEFIILHLYADLGQAFLMAERIRDNVQSYRSNQVGTVICSFGVAVFEEGDEIIQSFRESAAGFKKPSRRVKTGLAVNNSR
jgi:Amt family ammonium transporter